MTHTQTNETLSSYKDDVRALANGRVDKRFLNDSPAHAKIIAEAMLGASTAEECVIYSGGLTKDCYGQALESFTGQRIRVIVEHEQAIETIQRDYAQLLASHKLLLKILLNKDGHFDAINHFFVSGDSYRYELDHPNARAISNFNEPDTAQKLKANFEKMWEVSKDALQP